VGDAHRGFQCPESNPQERKETGRDKWASFDLGEEVRTNYKNKRAVHTIPGKGMFRACLAGNSTEGKIKGKFSEVVQDLQ